MLQRLIGFITGTYTVDDIGDIYMGVPSGKIEKWIEEGKLQSLIIFGHVRVSRYDVYSTALDLCYELHKEECEG